MLAPLLATVWSSSALACAGMALGATDHVSATAQHAPHGEHDDHGERHRGHLPVPADDPAAHDHSVPGAEHGNCPHCPGTAGFGAAGNAGGHLACAAADDVAGAMKPAGVVEREAPVLALLPAAAALSDPPPIGRRASAARSEEIEPHISRHLRHCVFLI